MKAPQNQTELYVAVAVLRKVVALALVALSS